MATSTDSSLGSYYNNRSRVEEFQENLNQLFQNYLSTCGLATNKPTDEITIQLENERRHISKCETQINQFEGHHRNGEYLQIQETLFQISSRLDAIVFLGRTDLKGQRKELLIKIDNLTIKLASRIHESPSCTPYLLLKDIAGKLVLNEEGWKCVERHILTSANVSDPDVAIVAIIGQHGVGKSLLANYVVEYLEHCEDRAYDWLQTGSTCGQNFWRFGPQNSSGLSCWPIGAPILQTNGRQLFVLVFDISMSHLGNGAGVEFFQKINQFCLSTSSITIYYDSFDFWNSNQHVPPPTWIPVATFLKTLCGERPQFLQQFHIVLRDWNDPKAFHYGSVGGLTFLENVLKNSGQSPVKLQSPLSGRKNTRFLDYLTSMVNCVQPCHKTFGLTLLPMSKVENGLISRAQSSHHFVHYFSKLVAELFDPDDITPVIREDQVRTFDVLKTFFLNILKSIDPATTDLIDGDVDMEDLTSKLTNLSFGHTFTSQRQQTPLVNTLLDSNNSGSQDMGTSVDSVSENMPKNDFPPLTHFQHSKESMVDTLKKFIESKLAPLQATLGSDLCASIPDLENRIEQVKQEMRKEFPIENPAQVEQEVEVKFENLRVQNKKNFDRQKKLNLAQQQENETKKAEMAKGQEEARQAEIENLKKLLQETYQPVVSSFRKKFEQDPYYVSREMNQEQLTLRNNLVVKFPKFFDRSNNIKAIAEFDDRFNKEFVALNELHRQNGERLQKTEGQIDSLLKMILANGDKWFANHVEKWEGRSDGPKFDDAKQLHQLNFEPLLCNTTDGTPWPCTKKIFNDTLRQVTDICQAVNQALSFVSRYRVQMQKELGKVVCVAGDLEFEKIDKAVVSALSQQFRKETTGWSDWCKKKVLSQANLSMNQLRHKFLSLNSQILKEEAKVCTSAMELAIKRYVETMTTITESNIFTDSEIRKFHKDALGLIKTACTAHPRFQAPCWSQAWLKLEANLGTRVDTFIQRNQTKIENQKRQRRMAFMEAEAKYKKLMQDRLGGNTVNYQGEPKVVTTENLNAAHKLCSQESCTKFKTKMAGFGNSQNIEMAVPELVQRLEKLKKEFVQENQKRRAAAAELKVKEEERVAEEKKKKEAQKTENQQREDVKKPPGDGPKNSKSSNPSAPTLYSPSAPTPYIPANPPSSSGPNEVYGIGIHFSSSVVQVGARSSKGFNIILTNCPPLITITPTEFFIGEDANAMKHAEENHNFNLFELLENKNASHTMNIGGKPDQYRTEQIVAMFLHEVKLQVQKCMEGQGSSVCVMAVSPFLKYEVKQSLKMAGKLAGFKNFHLIQTTTAIASSYRYSLKEIEDQTQLPIVVVIHSSSHCFDIALSKIGKNLVKIKALTGQPYMGKKSKLEDFQRFCISRFDKVTGSHKLEKRDEKKYQKELMEKVEQVLAEADVKKRDVKTVICAVETRKMVGKVAENLVESLLQKSVQTVDEMSGIVFGATELSASYAGTDKVPKITYNELYPYKVSLFYAPSPQDLSTEITVFARNETVTVKRFEFTIPHHIKRLTLTEQVTPKPGDGWGLGEYVISNVPAGSPALTFVCEVNSKGSFKLTWRPTGYAGPQLNQKVNWMLRAEVQNAEKVMAAIFNYVGKVDPPPSTVSLKTVTSFSASGAGKGTSKSSSSTMSSETQNPATGDGGGLPEKELQYFVYRVEKRLASSTGTNYFVRDHIQKLIAEIKEFLQNSTEPVDPIACRTFYEKLQTNDKQIK